MPGDVVEHHLPVHRGDPQQPGQRPVRPYSLASPIAAVQLAVHAAIGAIHSTLFFRSGLADDRLTQLLAEMAHACLGVPTPSDS